MKRVFCGVGLWLLLALTPLTTCALEYKREPKVNSCVLDMLDRAICDDFVKNQNRKTLLPIFPTTKDWLTLSKKSIPNYCTAYLQKWKSCKKRSAKKTKIKKSTLKKKLHTYSPITEIDPGQTEKNGTAVARSTEKSITITDVPETKKNIEKKTLFDELMEDALSAEAIEQGVVWELEIEGLEKSIRKDITVELINGRYHINTQDALRFGLDKIKKIDTTQNFVDLSEFGTLVINQMASKITLHIHYNLRKAQEFGLLSIVSRAEKISPPIKAYGYNYLMTLEKLNQEERTLNVQTDFAWNLDFIQTKIPLNFQKTQTGTSTFKPEIPSISITPKDLELKNNKNAIEYELLNIKPKPSLILPNNPIEKGAQMAKNLAYSSNLTTMNTTSFSGVLTSDSLVEVYVDGQLNKTFNIKAGPYEIKDIVAKQGVSKVELRITDINQNVSSETKEIIGGQRLFAPGLSDFALYGGKTNSDSTVLGGFYRKGIFDWLTAEAAFSQEKTVTKTQNKIYGVNLSMVSSMGSFEVITTTGNVPKRLINYQTIKSLLGVPYGISASIENNNGLKQNSLNLNAALKYAQLSLSKQRSDTADSFGIGISSSFSFKSIPISLSIISAKKTNLLTGQSEKKIDIQFSIPLSKEFKTDSGKTSLSSAVLINRQGATPKATLKQKLPTGDIVVEKDKTNTTLLTEQEYKTSALTNQATFYNQRTKDDEGNKKITLQSKGSITYAAGNFSFSNTETRGAFVIVDAKFPNIEIMVNEVESGVFTDKNGKAVVSEGLIPLSVNRIGLNSLKAPAKYDGRTIEVVPDLKNASMVSFDYPTLTLVKTPWITEGVLSIDQEDFPITEDGAYVTLSAGKYRGFINQKTEIEFDIPESDPLDTAILETLAHPVKRN